MVLSCLAICLVIACGGDDPSGLGTSGVVVINPEIEPNPEGYDATWNLTGPDKAVFTGRGDSVIISMVPGSYVIVWGPVRDRVTPPNTSAFLESDSVLVLSTIYNYSSGSINIDPDPDALNASWTLSGPSGQFIEGAGDTAMTDMDVGNYSLVWNEVEEYETPPSQVLKLDVDNALTFAAEYVRSKGTISIDPDPGDLAAPWTLTGPEDFALSGVGDTLLADMAIGDYTIAWGDVPGRVTPDPETALHTDDAILVFRGDYPLMIGSISIDPNPDILDASWTLNLPSDETIEGSGDTVLVDMEIGRYSLVWHEVAGYMVPAPGVAELEADDVLTFTTEYIYASGAINVNPNPDDLFAPWTLTGPEDYTASGAGDSVFTYMRPGDYTVVWGDLLGLVTPAEETAVLEAEQMLVFTSHYTFESGTVRIDPDPDALGGTWTLSGPANFFLVGEGDTTMTGMLAGNYTLVWGDVPDFQTPPAEVAPLIGGETLVFEAVYSHQVGSISIDTEIAPNPFALTASWTLVSDGDFTLSGEGDTTLWVVETGDYTLTWNGVEGYDTPAEESLSLEADGVLSFVGEYRPDYWVTSVTGALTHGEAVTIVGDRFGTKETVTPVAWDDMESGAFSDDWDYTGDLGIDNEHRHPNSMWCGALNMQGSLGESANKGYFRAGQDSPNPWFAQFWFKMNSNFNWGTSTYGNGDENLACVKFFRMWSTGSTSENVHLNAEGYGDALNLSVEYIDTEGEGRFQRWFMGQWTKDTWHCIQVEFLDSDQGVGNGECRMWFDGRKVLDQTNLVTREASAAYKRPAILGFYDAWSDDGTDRDDFYIDDAYVDDSWSRVELGDNFLYEECTHRELQVATAWAEDSIEFSFNQGSFESGDAAYIFVTDGDGNVSPGYPVVIE